MTPSITQLGVGGIFVLLLLQLLLPWLLKVTGKNGNGKAVIKSGELDPSYWHKIIHDLTEDVMQRGMIQLLKPSLDAQTDILREIRENSRDMRDNIKQLVQAQESAERRRES